MKQLMKIALYLLVTAAAFSARADAFVDFFRAVGVDDARTVSRLLSRGFDPNAVDDRGLPALVLAIREDSPQVVEALLAAPGLKVDATTSADETPLMMAALKGRTAWMRRLLDRGAQLERSGWTPLLYAASGPESEAVKLLLDRGARVDGASANRSTPLMMAARYGTEASAELLLARGADPRARNDLGLSAADFARAAGREALAQRLDRAAR